MSHPQNNTVSGRQEVSSFSDIEEAFRERVQRIIWCNVATIDTLDRPRSRIMHPLWQGAIGWITTRRYSLKTKHLAHNPFVSLAYIADIVRPVYIDCKAVWIDDLDQKQRVWQLCQETPPPVGFDPASIFERVDNPNFGVLQLLPWRIELATMPNESIVWHSDLHQE